MCRFLDGKPLEGVQHKYRGDRTFFPLPWADVPRLLLLLFSGGLSLLDWISIDLRRRFQNRLIKYLKLNHEVRDFLLTGGDPMVMNSRALRSCLEPILGDGMEHIRTIRIGTKSLAYWPYRYVNGPDSDDTLRLFEQIVESGKHLAIMAHFSHPNELKTDTVREAIRRIRNTGAEIRMQAPMIRHVNDRAENWRDLWTEGVRLGMIPYYLFVEKGYWRQGIL